jgi:general stress protein 26
MKDRAEMERRWSVIYKAWFPEGLDTKGIALLKVHIDAVRRAQHSGTTEHNAAGNSTARSGSF